MPILENVAACFNIFQPQWLNCTHLCAVFWKSQTEPFTPKTSNALWYNSNIKFPVILDFDALSSNRGYHKTFVTSLFILQNFSRSFLHRSKLFNTIHVIHAFMTHVIKHHFHLDSVNMYKQTTENQTWSLSCLGLQLNKEH